jgi:hypothetical protein
MMHGQRKRGLCSLELSWSNANKKLTTTNKKCMAFIENTIEPSLLSSIEGCTSAIELLDRIKSQFTSSSKTCHHDAKTVGERKVYF